jgi:uncharacterized membrane protein
MAASKIDIQQLSKLAERTGQDMEMSYGTLFLIAVMGVFYIAVSSVGIKTFNDCDQVQNSQKWKNLKMFLSHTMTAAIAMILTLLLTKIVKSEAAAFGLLFSIFGLIASSMTLAMTNECSSTADKSARNFGIVSLVGHILLLMASMGSMWERRGVKMPSLKRWGIQPNTRMSSYRPSPGPMTQQI